MRCPSSGWQEFFLQQRNQLEIRSRSVVHVDLGGPSSSSLAAHCPVPLVPHFQVSYIRSSADDEPARAYSKRCCTIPGN